MTVALRPDSLNEALGMLTERPGLIAVAGCTDLMVGDALARARMDRLIDISRIEEFRRVRADDSGMVLGATTTFSEIRRSSEVRQRFPMLAAAAARIGGWQIQNRATLGGNIANASPAGDSLPALLALGATIVAVGPRGRREIPYDGFHVGYRRTALAPGELIGWIRLEDPPEGTRQLFRKVGTREAQAISKVVVALAGRVENGAIAELRIGAGSVAPTPIRLTEVEQTTVGRPVGDETATAAGRLAAASVDPIDDVRSTAGYRRWALERVVRRMILELGRDRAAVDDGHR